MRTATIIGRPVVALAVTAAMATGALAQEPTHAFMTASDGVQIHYAELGSGTPVILIHGYTANAEGKWFKPGIAQALAERHHIPVLAIVGGYDQPNARTHRMARELADFQLVMLPGETHGSAHFNPRDTEALVEFVREHDTGAAH